MILVVLFFFLMVFAVVGVLSFVGWLVSRLPERLACKIGERKKFSRSLFVFLAFVCFLVFVGWLVQFLLMVLGVFGL
jgi:hypothetical protein